MGSTKQEAPKRLAAYIRVSSVRGRSGEKFTSPDDQERHIRAWADAHGHTIVGDAWRELDVSGGSMNRPMLNEVLALVEADELDGLVVYSLDRFGRTLIGALTILERLHENGKLFASVLGGFDLDTDIGRMVLGMMLNLSQWERDRIKTRWREVKADRVLEKGWHISRWVPFGYVREQLVAPNGAPYLGRLVPDPAAGKLVTELFMRRAAGEDYSSLAEWIRSTGAVTSRGTAVWSLSSVRSLINNRVYLGEARGGVKGTPANPDAHLPLTDEATWLAANRVRPPRKAAPRGSTKPVLGLGLVRCADCRYVVGVQQQQPPQPGAFNYMCDRPWRGKDCPRPATVAAAARSNGTPCVDDVIEERVLARLDAEPSGFREIDDPGDVDIETLETELEHARARAVETATDFALEERIGTLAWEARCAAWEQRVQDATAALVAVRRSDPELVLGRSAREIADDWRAGRLSIDRKREVTASMVQAIFLRRGEGGNQFKGRMNDAKRAAYLDALRGRVHIVWVGDPEVEVPRQGHRYEAKPFEFPAG